MRETNKQKRMSVQRDNFSVPRPLAPHSPAIHALMMFMNKRYARHKIESHVAAGSFSAAQRNPSYQITTYFLMNTSITNFTITKTKYNIMVKVGLHSNNLAQCTIYAAQFEHSVFSQTTLHNENSWIN